MTLSSPKRGRKMDEVGSIWIILFFQFKWEMKISLIMGFFMFFRAFLIKISFELCGLNSNVWSFRSSRWRVFQKESWFSRLSHPILIADQKVAIICKHRPF